MFNLQKSQEVQINIRWAVLDIVEKVKVIKFNAHLVSWDTKVYYIYRKTDNEICNFRMVLIQIAVTLF